MPTFEEVLVQKPVILSGGGLFTFSSTMDVAQSTNDPNNYAVHGDNSRRGVAYTQKDFASTFGATIVFLSRQRYFVSSGPEFPYQFGTEFDLATPSVVGNRQTYHLIDGIFWILGDNFTPLVYAKADGTSLTSSSGWVDRSGDLSGIVGSAQYMRKASTAGFLYYIAQNTFTGGSPFYVFRGATATAPNVAFTNVTVTPPSPGSTSFVTGYDVTPDGQTHIFSCDQNFTYRSTDGGVTFATISPGINSNEIVYSPAFKRWVMCSSGGLYRYSDNNGSSWSVPTRLETNPKNSGSFQSWSTSYHIEKLDPDGRYLLTTSGFAPTHVYISENGGKSWAFMQQMMPPNYDVTQIPKSGSTVTAQLALVRTGTELLLYQGGTYNTDLPYNWNFDNAMFTSGPISFPL